MSDTTDREKEIFAEALALPTPEARSAFLKGACGDDIELRERIEVLLRAHAWASGFLPTVDHGVDSGSSTAYVPLVERPGSMIGPYKLLQKIGVLRVSTFGTPSHGTPSSYSKLRPMSSVRPAHAGSGDRRSTRSRSLLAPWPPIRRRLLQTNVVLSSPTAKTSTVYAVPRSSQIRHHRPRFAA